MIQGLSIPVFREPRRLIAARRKRAFVPVFVRPPHRSLVVAAVVREVRAMSDTRKGRGAIQDAAFTQRGPRYRARHRRRSVFAGKVLSADAAVDARPR